MKNPRRAGRNTTIARSLSFLSAFAGRRARIVPVALLCLLGVGCQPRVGLQGLVTNLDGEPLPGVAVKVEALQAFSISNGNGIFGTRPNTLGVPPGTWELSYIKSGYTTEFHTITTGKGRLLEVPPVSLWPLPAAKGVYVLEGLNYRPFTRATPDRYLRDDNSPVYGIKQEPELLLEAPPELIISHKMASYDWQLSRLEATEVLRQGVTASGADAAPESVGDNVWAAAIRLPIQALPVDQPEQLLWRINVSAPLGPGFYAIHWGGLDGDTTTEESVYLFGIADPEATAPEETAGDADSPQNAETPQEPQPEPQ